MHFLAGFHRCAATDRPRGHAPAVAWLGKAPQLIEPLVPPVQVDCASTLDAFRLHMAMALQLRLTIAAVFNTV